MKDFGQWWHCLRTPIINDKRQMLDVYIDLPERGQIRNPSYDFCHERYELEKIDNDGNLPPFWVVQVPWQIMDGHSDIFNTQAGLLIMALSQLSGGIMSLAEDYKDIFEPENEMETSECQRHY